MYILVTGGAGYIGSHTIIELLNAGHNVVAVDNLVNSSIEAIHRVERITEQHVPFYTVDVRDHNALSGVFKDHHINACIHFAGLKAVGESVQNPLEYYRNNLDSTLTLLECMAENDVHNIVFSSSATVYGSENLYPYIETMKKGPAPILMAGRNQ